MTIFGWRFRLASMALVAACGARRASGTGDPAPTQVLPRDRVFILESTGPQAEDTLVVFSPRQDRTVVLRRGPPDNTVFLLLRFPAGSALPPQGTDSVRLAIRPSPGLYGVELDTPASFRDGAEIRFSYAVHFTAPAGARERYGSDLALERALHIGLLGADGRLTLITSQRPASDILAAPLPRPGRYLVGAPR